MFAFCKVICSDSNTYDLYAYVRVEKLAQSEANWEYQVIFNVLFYCIEMNPKFLVWFIPNFELVYQKIILKSMN